MTTPTQPVARVSERIVVRSVDAALVAQIGRELTVPAPVATVLVARGLTSFDACKKFFNPDIADLHDPFLFRDMDKAVTRIMAAMSAGEQIAVYGDYDVDGVTATAMLVRVLRTLGAQCRYYLPNRLTEGYGLSDKGIRELAEGGVRLVITVDCGITAHEEAALARELGLDLIVTDHHEPKDTLPTALAVIDPKVHGCGYPDADLAGVGVALKLAQALAIRAGRGPELWSEYLDLVALGTAADIVPLTGENRILASAGFARMSTTTNIGLRRLIEVRGLAGKKLSTSPVVFQLAPCINAAGRLGDPRRGVELLLTQDPAQADAYARELVSANEERRVIDARVQEEAVAWVGRNCDMERDWSIVAGDAAWHCGVIGIVASKVIERFHRPTILFSFGEDGLAKGSGRSIPGFHLLDAITECSSCLESFGGHAAAAGMVVRQDRLAEFRERFNAAVRSRITVDDLVPTVTADAEVRMADLTPRLHAILARMEPFGPGNMRPVFLCRDLKHRFDPRVVGAKHLKMSLTDGSTTMDAIAFGFGDRIGQVRSSPRVSVAFSVDENEYNGRVSLQMKVKGVAS
jgi:single-stranded-DNA-specific exonuclease